MCQNPPVTVSLLDRRVYALADVDRLLALPVGTARRWIDGYDRGGVHYPPVVRVKRTRDEAVTWGEFVEARLLAEFRSRGASMQRLRPAVVQLRDEFGRYPLAHASPFLDVDGRELVRRVQDRVGISDQEMLVVVRSGQLIMSAPVKDFVEDVQYSPDADAAAVVPVRFGGLVTLDPLHQHGRPVVRAVPTEIAAEQFRAGESTEAIADLFELTMAQVEQAFAIRVEPCSVCLRASWRLAGSSTRAPWVSASCSLEFGTMSYSPVIPTCLRSHLARWTSRGCRSWRNGGGSRFGETAAFTLGRPKCVSSRGRTPHGLARRHSQVSGRGSRRRGA